MTGGETLADRLRAVGLELERITDPAAAWQRLHDRFGQRATLLDRYALEAAQRGITTDELDPELRARLTQEVLTAHWPGIEFIPGSERARQDPVEVVDYNPAWPERFGAWRALLSASLGAVARRIDHVGSTAVPDLAAKPVIDVQISVERLDEEDAYVPAIERLGIGLRMREPEHRYFRPAGERPRTVQVHACRVGSVWERDHLLFRDYLRTDATTRDAYAALKLELAMRYRDDRVAYTEAKTAFIADAMVRARAWAAETRWRLD